VLKTSVAIGGAEKKLAEAEMMGFAKSPDAHI
jgi:hypothetical protein